MYSDVRAINDLVEKESAFVDAIMHEVRKVIVGQEQMLERMLIGLLTGGHVLLGLCQLVKVGPKRSISSRLITFHLHRVLLVFKPFVSDFTPCPYETLAYKRCSCLHSMLLFGLSPSSKLLSKPLLKFM